MLIAVLGTGSVGRALAGRFDELGHTVTIGTRDPEATRGRTDDEGRATYVEWSSRHPRVALQTFAEAAAGAELVVNATGGDVSIDVLTLAGADHLAGKVLLDVANPLDHSHGFPPRLFVKDSDSLAETIQRAFPAARVVKSLNTMNADVMVRPAELPGPTSVFVSGEDDEAKQLVTGLLLAMGHTDVIDLGGLSTARGAEMVLPLWIGLRLHLGTNAFNFHVVR